MKPTMYKYCASLQSNLLSMLKLYYSPQRLGISLQNLPHFTEMFSSSVDRKQFHLHENSLPSLPPLPQHYHLLLFFFLLLTPPPPLAPLSPSVTLSRSQFRHMGGLWRHNPEVCGSPLNISSSGRSGRPAAARGRVQRLAVGH